MVYADGLRGFGNAVIVDHGGNYMTVYTGLSAIGKSVGSSVKGWRQPWAAPGHWTAANLDCTLRSDTWVDHSTRNPGYADTGNGDERIHHDKPTNQENGPAGRRSPCRWGTHPQPASVCRQGSRHTPPE
ncbi:hypothetical protein [Paludibacterium denitrificans]|uniref:hypothetical protein n=1 Tax=Paludibacterium denitrificans TaxID=2675226 RepID=UPI001E3D219C|nr:hypothetical protein [Paludibacterium denitrificans]